MSRTTIQPSSEDRLHAPKSQSAGRTGATAAAFREPRRADAIRLLCVDDHAVLVEGLKAQFDIDGRISVVGRLESAAGLIDAVDRTRAQAVLLDIEMPGPDAFEMADRLRRARPAIRIIVLSAHIRDAFVTACMAAGIHAYFAKSDEIQHIVDGIIEATRGDSRAFLLSPKVRNYSQPFGHGQRSGAPKRQPDSAATALSTLTARELEIVRLIGRGLTRVEIAAQLSRSVKTIDGHQARIMRKLGIGARADLMRFAIREGLSVA